MQITDLQRNIFLFAFALAFLVGCEKDDDGAEMQEITIVSSGFLPRSDSNTDVPNYIDYSYTVEPTGRRIFVTAQQLEKNGTVFTKIKVPKDTETIRIKHTPIAQIPEYYIYFYSLRGYPCPPSNHNNENSIGDVCTDGESLVVIGILGKNNNTEEFGNEFELQINDL